MTTLSADTTAEPGFLAERRARAQLGGIGRRARFDWSRSDGSTIRLVMHVPTPGLLGSHGRWSIHRRFEQRVERRR